jgi:hypothetical protein
MSVTIELKEKVVIVTGAVDGFKFLSEKMKDNVIQRERPRYGLSRRES